MPYALSGDAVIQTGTDDTNFTGIENVAGITIFQHNDLKIVNFRDDRRFEIQGTQNHDPDRCLLTFNGTPLNPILSVRNNGVYNFGVETTANGNTIRSQSVGIRINGEDTNNNAEFQILQYGGLVIYNGGTFRARGGVICSTRLVGFSHVFTGSTEIANIDVQGTIFVKTGGVGFRQIRFESGEGRYSGSFQGVVKGFNVAHRDLPPGGISFDMEEGQLIQISGGPLTSTFRDLDFSNTISTDYDVGSDSQGGVKTYTIINSGNGSALRCMPRAGIGGNRQLGVFEISKELTVKVTDLSNDPLEDAAIFIRDTNNGFRKNANGANNLADKTYTQVTDANGDTPTFSVVTAITNINSQGAFAYSDWDTTAFSNRYKVDRRGNDDTTNDEFNIIVLSYAYLPGVFTRGLLGVGTLNVETVLFDDNFITAPRATTIALTEISNANELYDYIQYLLRGFNNAEFVDEREVVTAEGTKIIIASGWTLEGDASQTEPVDIDIANTTITVKFATGGVSRTEQFNRIEGTVDSSFGDNTDLDYVATAGQTNLRISNLVSGASVSVLNGTTEVGQNTNVTGTSVEIDFSYTADFTATIRVLNSGFRQLNFSADIVEGIVNVVAPDLVAAEGLVDSTALIRNIDGNTLNATGIIDITTATKVFDLISDLNARQVFSVISRGWGNTFSNQFFLPTDVDRVSGLALLDGWSFTADSYDDHLEDEGILSRDADGDITDLKYNIKIEDNNTEVRYQITTDGTAGTVQTVAAGSSGTVALNTLIDIDHTADDVSISVKAKDPQFQFKIVNEDIIRDGTIVSDRFRLSDTDYLVGVDTTVPTNELPVSGYGLIPGAVTVADENGVNRTFSNGELRLRSGTSSLSEVISLLAAIATDEFDIDSKLFTLTNSNTQINVDDGYYLTINAAPLSGTLRALVRLFDDNGTEFATPAYRTILLRVPTSWSGNTINYTVLAEDADIFTDDPTILEDIDGDDLQGTLTPSTEPTPLITIQSADIDVVIIWGAADVEIGVHRETLDSDGIDFVINPQDEVVQLYKDESQTTDDPAEGTKAWNDEIDNIVIDSSERDAVYPNAIRAAELSYAYRAWRKWLEADLTRLRFGTAFVGINQERPTNATDNAYLFNPSWFLSFGWVVDVRSDRDTATDGLIEYQASGIGRYETNQGFPEQNGGVIYASPQANGEAPVIQVIQGFTTFTLSSIDSKVDDIQARVATTGTVLLPDTQDKIDNTNLRVNNLPQG